VTVNYTGWLYDATKTDNKGPQFDSSVGRTPFQFTLGTGQVIRGWDQGIPGMKVGGRRRLVIPPSLAYGSTRSGPIPPNATLVFDVEMVSIP
jgi:FKBP-type peptidyl-prolyl cis-trans isomerase FkpA